MDRLHRDKLRAGGRDPEKGAAQERRVRLIDHDAEGGRREQDRKAERRRHQRLVVSDSDAGIVSEQGQIMHNPERASGCAAGKRKIISRGRPLLMRARFRTLVAASPTRGR